MITDIEMVTRIAIGAALGGVIGFERDIHGRHVGLRTHLIVSMASATFMVISCHFVPFQHYETGTPIAIDTSRIAASVVTGIGFLAGGAILKTGTTIQGITTAAGLWLVTAIGMAAGAGMYIVGFAVTCMGLMTLTVLRLLEDKDDGRIRRHVSLTVEETGDAHTKIIDALSSVGATVRNFEYEKTKNTNTIGMKFEVRIPVSMGAQGFVEFLEKQANVQHIHIQIESR